MIQSKFLHITSSQALLFIAAALLSLGLIMWLRPILVRYALARPNARSSHRIPTPQGAGIAVVAATIASVIGAEFFAQNAITNTLQLIIVLACAAGLAVVGVTDDIRPLEAWPRLLLQSLTIAILLAVLPSSIQIINALPWWTERAILFIALLWFVNLVNFMDGIDWMTVAEVVPVTAALGLFGLIGALPNDATLVALALCGAMIGFAPFNRPVARVFLGDVGSLPIGLLLGWLLVLLSADHLVAALLLPLYYVADATITLLRRLAKGEQVTQAHRSHFYQRALDRGFSVHRIVGGVFLVNIALAALATITVIEPSLPVHVIALIAGCAIVGALLRVFETGKVR